MKKVIFLILIIALLIGSEMFIFRRPQSPTQSLSLLTPAPTDITVTQVITATDNESSTIKKTVKAGKTALNFLQETATITTQGTGKNAFVISINKKAAETAEREYWSFYVNGKLANVGAGSYTLQPNDSIKWKLETY